MTSARRALVIVAAVAGAAAIVAAWLAPAALVDARLARMTGGRVRLVDTEGTVWRARGTLAAGTVRLPIAWRVEPWPLLSGELRVDLVQDARGAGGSPRARIAIAAGRVSLRDVDASFPATLVAAVVGPGSGWTVGGELHVSAASVNWTPTRSDGEARVQWRQARLGIGQGTEALDLGDVSLPLLADGDRLAGTISNDGGDLAIRGDVAFHAANGVAVSLLLAPRRAEDAALSQVLSGLGTAEGGGWRIVWKRPLR